MHRFSSHLLDSLVLFAICEVNSIEHSLYSKTIITVGVELQPGMLNYMILNSCIKNYLATKQQVKPYG